MSNNPLLIIEDLIDNHFEETLRLISPLKNRKVTATLFILSRNIIISITKGNVLIGYDENGFYPMFKDYTCSIYKFRPQTCRQYDCRVFPATGISEHSDKPKIIEQFEIFSFFQIF